VTKDSLIKGTVILAGAAFIARFLGVIQRIPLQNMLGDGGMASYGIAYNLYFLLLTVATVGIPSTLSKMISERQALGQYAEANKIYRAAIFFAVGAGVIITGLLYGVADAYAHLSGDPEATLAIWALAPAMLLFPLIAIMRGYFQGHQQMMPGGVSQVVEQILRVVTAILFAYVILQATDSIEYAAAGASFGGVTGAIGAFLVMLWFAKKLKKSNANEPGVSLPRHFNYRHIYGQIFKLSIPISLISIAVPLIYFIDSTVTIPILKGTLGYEHAKDILGILTGRAQSLAGIPIIMAIALSMSIVPIVSAAFAKNDLKEVQHKAAQALRVAVITGLPLVLMLVVGARAINGLMFTDTQGSWIIAALVAGSLIQILMMTSAAILMGIGHTKAPMNHVFIGIVVKLVGSLILGPIIGIYGIIVATALCFLVTASLNFRVLRRIVPVVVLGSRLKGMVFTVILLSGVGFILDWAAQKWISTSIAKLDYFIAAVLVCGTVVALYPVLLLVLRAVKMDDLGQLPGPVRKGMGLIARRLGM
jgi:stage V sporulation protein B